VGGHRITSEELRSRFQEMGFRDVETFRASGNVVFAAGEEAPAAITARVQEGLAASLGYEVSTFLRSAGEVRAIAALRPFAPARLAASAGRMQVVLLSKRAATATREQVLSLATGQDGLAFGERELYWLPRAGTMDSELDLKMLERLLGQMTIRTKGTVEQFAGRHFPG
jgi:uncharacterized protein (DUF1697 family)